VVSHGVQVELPAATLRESCATVAVFAPERPAFGRLPGLCGTPTTGPPACECGPGNVPSVHPAINAQRAAAAFILAFMTEPSFEPIGLQNRSAPPLYD
jgi:hypothetical protein